MPLQRKSKENIVSHMYYWNHKPPSFMCCYSNRCCHTTAREAPGTTEPWPQTRCGVPGCICWCGWVQVAIPGYHFIPKWERDKRGEGGGALPTRPQPPDAEEMGFKGSAMPRMVSYARDSRPSHCSSTSECNSTIHHIHIHFHFVLPLHTLVSY